MTTSRHPDVALPPIEILSCVGGGPMERLAAALRNRGVQAEVRATYTPEAWRALMAGGMGRLRARMASSLFPVAESVRALRGRDSILVPTTNPFFLPLVLIATRALHGRHVVPLVYDLYPDALEAGGLARTGGMTSGLFARLNAFWLRHASAAVFIGPAMAAHVQRRYGTPPRSAVLETGADGDELRPGHAPSPANDLERFLERRLVVGYVGNLGHVHDWETAAAGIQRLLASPPEGKPLGVLVAASGPGVESWRRAWSHHESVRFVAPLSDEQWRRVLPRIDLSLVTLREAAAHTSIPSKTFSAMAAGSAILAVAPPESDLARVVAESGGGNVVRPGDVDGFVTAVERLVHDQDALAERRRRARAAIDERYDIPVLAERWIELLDEVAESERDLGSYEGIKRTIDVLGASVGLGLTAPILGLSCIAVRLTMGSPVFFRQERPGLGGGSFQLLKLRTMKQARPGEGAETDGQRLTPLGRLLRRTSLDELPTLWNVLRGDMSLVGPRPLLVQYLDRYTPRQARRHEVKPGVTGWAQVNGRNALSWEERFEHDVWYVDHRSLALDLRILLLTVRKVLRRDDISHAGHATMPEFTGTASAAAAPAAEE